MKGSVYELKRKCGKPGCKCTKGQLHARMVLSASEGGRTTLDVIPSGFLVEVKIKVQRYQELRRCRARLGELHTKMLQIIDEMEAMRREEMIPGKRRATAERSEQNKRNKGVPQKRGRRRK
ncbi:DUF6788 family protein [candidate division CSSED10-310 bacterium]|uniref:DUF6788 family protein n=1 Tax=candidate division CSSED10-310 bacterium TaxID=2855610 RepID=A0ABV6Z4F0_UNCC1